MDYDLYHDESKQSGYWHGMLLVAQRSRHLLLEHLALVRSNTGYKDPIELKGLNKPSGPKYRTIRAWMIIATAALIQNFKGNPCHIYTGDDGRSASFGRFTNLVGDRFILPRIKDGHISMTGYRDDAARVETTFRVGFKGGVHLFANTSGDGLVVKSFHFDGYRPQSRHQPNSWVPRHATRERRYRFRFLDRG